MPRKTGKKSAGKYPSKRDKSAAKAERRLEKRVTRVRGQVPISAKEIKDNISTRPHRNIITPEGKRKPKRKK